MPRSNHESWWIPTLAVTGVMVLLLKLFTIEVGYVDDPTVALAVRIHPGWSNTLPVSDPAGLDDLYVLFSDESDYIGSEVYRALVSVPVWIGAAMVGVIIASYRRRRRTGR